MNQHEGDKKITESIRDASSFISNMRSNDSGNSGESGSKHVSNLLQIPSISLPKGGGAMKSIDEKFSVNAANGTASYSIPLPFSPGRNGATPGFSVSYNSGSGNSFFGLGWNIGIPCIQRKTEKELPAYRDSEESDTFIFSGAEDLVPELVQDAGGQWVRRTGTENNATITYYRPRIEGGFARIEKLNDQGNVYWRVRTKDNQVSVFGQSDAAKLFSPVSTEGKDKIFRWCLEYSYDDKGNFVQYIYKQENADNITPSLSEKNRLNGIAPFSNVYPKSIRYGNTTAWYEGDPMPTAFLFELVFDYGEHDPAKPTTTEITKWSLRQDPFSDYHSGFDIRTYRLCQRVLMFHHLKTELGWDDYLVRSQNFSYDEQPSLTYLDSVTQTGYIWNTDGSLQSMLSLPPMEFSYFKPGYSQEVQEISPANMMNAPAGLDPDYQWLDLYSEGISGILSEQSNGWFYKENLGNGSFSPAQIVSPHPSLTGLRDGALSIQDLEADGRKYLVSTHAGLSGYYALGPDFGLASGPNAGAALSGGSNISSAIDSPGFRPFEKYPNINIKDPNLKFLDLNGDGMPDMLISQAQDFIWYASKGKFGYDDYHLAARAGDEERGPQILFADKDEKMLIATADMSGDGLSDIVLITCANVCYYPNLGYGRFGAKVTLEMTGAFADYDTFSPQYIYLADIDGSGTTDIVYSGNGNFQIWFNQGGNSLSDPSVFFNPFPELDNQSRISLIDLLGNGVACIVWSSSMPAQGHAPLRYIDLMGGRKPHVMYGYKNNIGREVTLEYESSTHYYLADKQKGRPWVTRLPFPVQCVSKVTVVDKVSQTRFTNEYCYHHGYYDAKEREFRGFAMVEQKDSEEYDQFVQAIQGSGAQNTIEKDLYQPTVITRTWFHTGAWLHRAEMFHQLQFEYFPNALIATGQLTNADWIAGLSDYLLDESSSLPDGLAAGEISECFRALKGLPLRQEIYSDEGDVQTQLIPYAVTQHNYDVQLLQPKAHQKYAIFFTHEKETLTFNYERNPLDPRIAHAINIAIDPYGNVLQSASIVYGRQNADPGLPTDADRQKQAQQYIVYTQNLFTALIDTPTTRRLPAVYDSQTWELNAPAPSKIFYNAATISNLFASATIILYEQQTIVNQKRKTGHSRTLFMKNDLSGPMLFGSLDTLALPYENYVMAFTPTLGPAIYGGKFDDSLWRNKALYVNFQGDTNYWVRSGKTYFYPDLTATPDAQSIPAPTPADLVFAKANFYLAIAYEDNFGNLTKTFYDPYKLFVQRTVDAVNNEANADAFNYRTLTPYLLRDANDNRTGIRLNELGLVTHTFVMGKETEFKGDPMDTNSAELSPNDQPTSIITYAFRYYSSGGQLPDLVMTSLREQHYYTDPLPAQSSGGISGWLQKLFGGGSPTIIPAAQVIWQNSYSYSDGSGHVVLTKIQAEPGLAPQRNAQGQLVYDVSGNVLQADTTPNLRWVGNGRTIYNNKGKAVKQYEPYFDSIPEYNTENELVQLGVTNIHYYDALGRLMRTKHPNGTFSRIGFDAWMQETYDENDTVLDSSWYQARINGALGEAEQEAAQKAAIHANTPSIAYLDALGRPYLALAENATQRSSETLLSESFYTRMELDIQGNVQSISDARGNIAMSWEYSMTSDICYQHSMDAGDRWMLSDVTGKPLRLWDSRQQIFTYVYDGLHRPLNLIVNTGAGDTIFEQFQYGEGITNDKQNNLRGKLYNHYDTAGLYNIGAYDFKGNKLTSSRRLLKDYKNMPDWSVSPVLETEQFSDETAYDALDRPIQFITIDKSIFAIGYNEGSLLNSIDVQIRGVSTVTHFVTQIGYNAKRARAQIFYGNNTATNYTYDPQTYLLTSLVTTGNNGNTILQDLSYTYDPTGNITRQFDNAQKTVFYGGQQVEAQSDYIYDALYRLVEAAGREHTGQIGVNAQDNWNDSWCMLGLQPNSPIQLRNYTQKYFYDGVGNILQMQHITTGTASWTRTYQYNAANNQVVNTKTGGQNYSYTYNVHGSMSTMPQLQGIDWNFREEMQHAGLGGGGDAYYVYDSSGQRIRKVIVKQGNKTAERIYLGGVEIYRERTGSTITLERSTLHIMDDQQRIAMVDTRTKGNDGTMAQLIRYQYSNHLGSACLELDDAAKIITYEEYHPFGTTAYQATDASRQVPAKRYRYTGMERDDETGLNYHSQRYYIPWLGRWTAADPIGIKDDLAVYAYCKNNPVRLTDLNGTDSGTGTIKAPAWAEIFKTPEWKAAIKKALAYQPKLMSREQERAWRESREAAPEKPKAEKPAPPPAAPAQEAAPEAKEQPQPYTPPGQAYQSGSGQNLGGVNTGGYVQGLTLTRFANQNALNVGLFPQGWPVGLEAIYQNANSVDPTGAYGGSNLGGLHFWAGLSRINLSLYALGGSVIGQNPAGASGTNGTFSSLFVFESLLGGPDRDHPLLTLGLNFNAAYQRYLQILATGLISTPGGPPTTTLRDTALLGGVLNATFNLIYRDRTPLLNLWVEGYLNGAGNDNPYTPPALPGLRPPAALSSGGVLFGGGTTGITVNYAITHLFVITGGAFFGVREQRDTVGATHYDSTNVYGGAGAGAAYRF
jgi:RHS repeat-associated protein